MRPLRQHKSTPRRTPAELRQLVARTATRQLPTLAPRERADVLEGIALLLTDAQEQDLVRHTVGLIRQAEEHERMLLQRLTRTVL